MPMWDWPQTQSVRGDRGNDCEKKEMYRGSMVVSKDTGKGMEVGQDVWHYKRMEKDKRSTAKEGFLNWGSDPHIQACYLCLMLPAKMLLTYIRVQVDLEFKFCFFFFFNKNIPPPILPEGPYTASTHGWSWKHRIVSREINPSFQRIKVDRMRDLKFRTMFWLENKSAS